MGLSEGRAAELGSPPGGERPAGMLERWRRFFDRVPDGGRLARAMEAEEEAVQAFAFIARTVAVVAVALWLPSIVPAPRVYYYLACIAGFFVLGLVPHLLRHHRHGNAIKLVFTLLDAALITTVIIVPPPDLIDRGGWPVQMRIRFSEYLYLLLLLVGSVLSYSPFNVIWTGLCVIVTWCIGSLVLYRLPDSIHTMPPGEQAQVPVSTTLDIVLSPTFVSLSSLWNELVLTAIATGLLAAAVARSRRLLWRQTRAEVARADLVRYVSPDVADAMLVDPDQDLDQSKTRIVAVLFADIIGFSTMAERLPPGDVVTFLRSFYQRSCTIVFAHGGTLDKYLGDGFMATFGALGGDPDVAARALSCAFELQREVESWSEKRVARGADPVAVAIGVHCGRVTVGNVGSESRLEFTVIGDAVNVASRLEQLTRDQRCRIAVSEECLRLARDGGAEYAVFRPIGEIQLRGREQPVEVQVWP